jgi:hypothetical protein
MLAPMKVTLTEEPLAGTYVVREQHDDGTLVLRPETSEEVIEQFADRPLSGKGVPRGARSPQRGQPTRAGLVAVLTDGSSATSLVTRGVVPQASR